MNAYSVTYAQNGVTITDSGIRKLATYIAFLEFNDYEIVSVARQV